MTDHEPRARFTAMSEGTAEDWGIITRHLVPFAEKLPDRIMAHLMSHQYESLMKKANLKGVGTGSGLIR